MSIYTLTHRKLFLLFVVVVLGSISVWILFIKYQPFQKEISPAPTLTLTFQSPTVSTPTPTASTSTAQETKTYRNEKWGFEFRYPVDWNIREPAFGSAVSKFNMAVEPAVPHLPDPIRINILPNDWIDRVRNSFVSRGIIPSEIQIDGVTGYGYEHISEGLPQVDYLFARDEYWIVVGGKKQYKKTLNQILASFKFLNK